MADLEHALVLVEQHQDEADFDGSKPGALLEKAEQALGFSFPPTYRAFLSRLGCGDVAGEEFYGVTDDNFVHSSIPNGIWYTLDERKNFQLPECLIVVGSTGDGGLYATDCSQTSDDGEHPVVEWWSGPQKQSQIAHDFGEFFLNRIREALGE